MLPENQSTVNIPPQLFFCYNRQKKDILYTNIPLQKYFGTGTGQVADLGLFTHPEWHQSLLLNAPAEHRFTFRQNGSKEDFYCIVKAIGTEPGRDGNLLMCEVTRRSDQVQPGSRDNYDEFIQLAAHDLDAPLRKLSVLIERLTGKIPTDSEAAAFVPRIDANIKDMRDIISGLTELANISLFADSPGRVDLTRVLENVMAEIRKKYAGKTVIFETNALPAVEGDASGLFQLFRNLIENAVVFSQNEQAFVAVFAAEASESEKAAHLLETGIKFYKITVLDKGIGFNQQDAEKIFRPFVRLNGKSAYPGSGLGLAVCKKIVENHHGAVYAEAVENEGARFIIFLPQSLN